MSRDDEICSLCLNEDSPGEEGEADSLCRADWVNYYKGDVTSLLCRFCLHGSSYFQKRFMCSLFQQIHVKYNLGILPTNQHCTYKNALSSIYQSIIQCFSHQDFSPCLAVMKKKYIAYNYYDSYQFTSRSWPAFLIMKIENYARHKLKN